MKERLESSTFLRKQGRALVIFGGKGGTGKTTSACATGLYLARRQPKRKMLIVSCDPAHSVGDSFGCKVGNTMTSIPGVANLWALEIKAEAVAEEFRRRHDGVMKTIADRGTYFDQEDIASFFSLSMPGLDEVMAVIRIADLLKNDQFDLIILDTAPTGHTLRLLGLPAHMKRWVEVMDLMQAKHRFLARQFTGRYKKDDADAFLDMMGEDTNRVQRLLADQERTEFVPVTIPEPMAVEETERLLEALKGYGMHVESILVNRVQDGSTACPYCSTQPAARTQDLAKLHKRFNGYQLVHLPLFPYEIRGLERLTAFGEALFGSQGPRPDRGQPFGSVRRTLSSWLTRKQRPIRLIKEGVIFYLFGGKGGVGKTSLACATALHLARRSPSQKVLLFSTDPAHSISDALNCRVGDTLTPIKGTENLFALEMNAERLLEGFKQGYRNDVRVLFERFTGGGVDIKFDREILEELVSITPPGFDEVMALRKVVEFVDEGRFDLYVLDMAATGHLLRFLEMPQITRDWLRAIFRLLIKYQGVMRLTKLAEGMVQFSKGVRRVQEILTTPKQCEFVVVTIPEAMGVAEADRLLRSLERLQMPCHHILVNMVLPATGCGFCESKREEQRQVIQGLIREQSAHYEIAEVHQFPTPIKGMDRLAELSRLIG